MNGDGSGSALFADEVPLGTLPAMAQGKSGTWGNLPPKLAQGLAEARREEISGDYRDMVQLYFKVVAEQAARDSKP